MKFVEFVVKLEKVINLSDFLLPKSHLFLSLEYCFIHDVVKPARKREWRIRFN